MPSDKKNSAWLSIQFVISVIFSLITLKLNISHFGKELFGVWIIFISIWNLGPALDLGFSTAIVKYVAEAHDKKKASLDQLLSTSFFSFLSIGILLFAAGNIIFRIFLLKNTSIVPFQYYSDANILSILLGIVFLISFISLFFKAVFEGSSNFVITSRIGLLQNILIMSSVILVTYINLSIISLAVFYIISQTIILIVLMVFYFKNFSSVKIRPSNFSTLKLKEIGSFSLSVQMVSIFNALIDPLIKFIIGNYNSISLVSVYEVARRFAISISLFFFTTFKTILPKTSILRNRKEYKDFLYNEGAKYTKLGIIYSGLSFGVFSIFIALFLDYWFGYKNLLLIFMMLALPESINNFGYTIYNFILGIGKASILALVQFTNLIAVVLAMSIIFVLFNSPLGLLGYFFSVIIGNTLMLFYVKKKAGIELVKFLKFIKFYKLIALITLLVIGVTFIYLGRINYVVIFTFLCSASLFLFFNDLVFYFRMFINQFKDMKF
ncbi:MAG TPA: oligosaccharide flippase family protein [Ignavibacteriaceae bacterium]|nr:oligosaccharide flippase family protein [Ignavibacteriaceae bacterium]